MCVVVLDTLFEDRVIWEVLRVRGAPWCRAVEPCVLFGAWPLSGVAQCAIAMCCLGYPVGDAQLVLFLVVRVAQCHSSGGDSFFGVSLGVLLRMPFVFLTC